MSDPSKSKRAPVVINLDALPETEMTSPADAPPVPEVAPQAAMQTLTAMAARGPSNLSRLFWISLIALVSLMLSLAIWDFVTGLLERNLWLGRFALLLSGILVAVLVIHAVRELAAFSRLSKVDHLQTAAREAVAAQDRNKVLRVLGDLVGLYRKRPELQWAMNRMETHKVDILDADALLGAAEQDLMVPLDKLARAEIESSARQVAAATALLPLALVDVVVALTANIRMVRRIAEIYGGRSGTFGSWRLLRAVASHLVATGAVAVGDDLIGSVAGGGALARVSRRFGEGVINGALTARVGVAAMEVCRPLPFNAVKRPRVTGLVKAALSGMFGKS